MVENRRFSVDYLDPEKRSIANAVQVVFADGTSTGRIEVEYPIGHRRRRGEAVPLLRRKFTDAMAGRFPPQRAEPLIRLMSDARLDATGVEEFMALLVDPSGAMADNEIRSGINHFE